MDNLKQYPKCIFLKILLFHIVERKKLQKALKEVQL